MDEDKIAKNLLLGRTCQICYRKFLRDKILCCRMLEMSPIWIYPKENTCPNWYKLSSLETSSF